MKKESNPPPPPPPRPQFSHTDEQTGNVILVRSGPLIAFIEDEWPLDILLCDAWIEFRKYPDDRPTEHHLWMVLQFLKKIIDNQGQGVLIDNFRAEIQLLIDIFNDTRL